MTVDSDLATLVEKARSMSSELLDVCRQYGLQPNFKKGKIMIGFCHSEDVEPKE